jgi:hypothetical protein
MTLVRATGHEETPRDRCYWVVEGQLLAGAYPGSPDAREQLVWAQSLWNANMRTFISLMEANEKNNAGDPFAPYARPLETFARASNQAATFFRLAIEDLGAPRADLMAQVVHAIDVSAEGRPVYLHCFGGVDQLQGARDARQGELVAISSELRGFMEQHVDVASKKLDDLRARAETCRKAIEHLERILELEELREEANKPKKKRTTDVAGAAVSTAQAAPFSREVEALLKAWHFPDLDRVSFSENDQDVVISGRARKSHGKGVRAITRAAFNLALLRLCIEDARPFPNFVRIDSPLLVYEEPDADESSFPQDIKKHFWESVKAFFADAQVIIIENSHQLPGDGVLDGVKVELFTGNDEGRRGFIPQAGDAA